MRVHPVVVVWLAATLPAAASLSQPYHVVLQRAEAAFAAEDFPATLELLDRALHLDADAPAAFVLLGQTCLRLGRYADASDALARGAELAGGTSTTEGMKALHLLAYSLAREDRNAEALDLLNRLVAVNPGRPAVWLLRGNIHLAIGRPEAAKLDFVKVIQLQAAPGAEAGAVPPAHTPIAAAYEGLGISAYRLGDDVAALQALKKAPQEQDARYHLALTLARLGSHAEALEMFEKVIASDPRHRGALQGLARSAGALGRSDHRERALSTLESLYRQDEERQSARVKVSLLRMHALARLAAGDTKVAVADLERAALIAPDDLEVKLDLGQALSVAGERRRGEEVLRGLIAQNVANAEAHFHLGRLLLDANDPDAATGPLEAACRIAPMKAAFRLALGQARIRTGRLDEGIAQLRFARKLAPADPENAYSLGLGLAQTGALREAVVELESAASLDLNDPRPHEALAEVYARLGDVERSRREQEVYRRLRSASSPPA